MRIALTVPAVEIGLRTLGFNRVVKFLQRFATTKNFSIDHIEEVEKHKRLLFLFYEQFPSSGKCLARALTFWVLLKRKGINTDLRFGMKKENEKLAAHAWVEYKGIPLTLDADVRQHYTAFQEPILEKALRL